MIHEKSTTRQSWAPHGVKYWYLGPTTEHYRCYIVVVTQTGNERIIDTVHFFHHDVPILETFSVDRAIEVAVELTAAIGRFKFVYPLKDTLDQQLDGLHKLA